MLSFTMVTKCKPLLVWKLHRFLLYEVVSKASQGSLLRAWFCPFLVFFQSNVFRKRVFQECSESINRPKLIHTTHTWFLLIYSNVNMLFAIIFSIHVFIILVYDVASQTAIICPSTTMKSGAFLFRGCVALTNLGSNGLWLAPNWRSDCFPIATAIAVHTAATEGSPRHADDCTNSLVCLFWYHSKCCQFHPCEWTPVGHWFFLFWQIHHLHGSRTCAKPSSHVLTLGNMELRPKWGMKCVLRCLCDPSLWGMQCWESERKTRVEVFPYFVHARLQCYRCAPFWNHAGQLRIIDSRLTSGCPASASSASLFHPPPPTQPVFGYFASWARTPLRHCATLWLTCEQESLPVQTNRRFWP